MRARTPLSAAILAALLSLGAVACDGEDVDVGPPDTGIAEEEMGVPGEAGGDVPADTGEQDL
jgi:hypothetical protein